MVRSLHTPTEFIPRSFLFSLMPSVTVSARIFTPLSLWLLVGIWCAVAASHAQTLDVANEVRTEATLVSGTVATLTGRAELHLTGTVDPTLGATIHLNSTDAWLFFTNLRPTVVQSSQLARVRVNGAAAVHGTNCRVVQYALGTVVIPHTPGFQPLQAFAGPDFSGASSSFSQYTYYNSAASLGSLNRAISSFRLKRGYMATFSTQTGGAGPARVYVAQDGDLEIGRLPAEIDDSVVFVRVLPWRWVSKKGSCDVAADTLNASWFYNWDNNQNSPLNWEYVPIRQQRWWPGYPTNKPDSTHLLGYNEPDNPVEDSYESLGNGSIDAAIAAWPELLASGLRVGSPAVTDGGESWLYEFMDKAAAAKLRVDYVAIHFYRCGYTASQLYDWLYNIHVRTGKPIWVTEFNNGANWTGCADPTYEQNATRLGEFIEMLDNAPFIERYAVYSRVEFVRQVTYDTGGLTPAGVVYRDNASPIGYRQAVPATGGRGVARLTFDDSLRDASGHSNHGLAVTSPRFVDSPRGRAIDLDGSLQAVQLPANVAASSSFSFAGWVYWDGGANWQRIFDFGDDTSRYLFLTPSSGSGTLRFATRNAGSEQIVQTSAALPAGQWTHVAVTLSGGTGRIYLNGVQAAAAAITITPSQLTPANNYLGKSQFPADPLFNGRLDDVYIADYAFTPAQVAALMTNTAPQFTSATITGAAAVHGQAYVGTLVGTASDLDAGDTLTFAKLSGPSWLVVAANGALSGTPTFGDSGLQSFVVTVTDSAGASASSVLTISLPSVIGNGTWTADLDGLWSDSTRWVSAFPANGAGQTANFGTINITADRTVTLDGSRSVGTLRFGDTSGAQTWTLAGSGGATLALATGSTSAGSVVVAQNTATITASLVGSTGLAKSGNGTLVLAGDNTLSGPLTIDSNSTTAAEGVVRLAHPDAASAFTSIQIRNNNSGSSMLELSGSAGGVISPASLALSGRTNTAVGLRNVTGDNTLSGTLTLNVGGAFYGLQSDAGTLTLGPITSAASASRTLSLSGAGNFTFAGAITNGSATEGITILKNSSGTLTLSGANTHTGSTTLNAGVVNVSGSGQLGTGPLSVAAGATLNLYRGVTLAQSVTGGGAIVNHGGTVSLSGNWSGFSGSYTLNTGTFSTAWSSVASASASASYHIAAATVTGQALIANVTSGTNTYSLGALGGVAGTILRNGNAVTGATTFQIGARGLDTEFAGQIGGGGGSVAVTKVGSGRLILSGTNIYAGATAVNAGTLLVNGTIGGGAVAVASGATLGGSGVIGGVVNVLAGGTLSPGPAGLGTLTVNNGLALQPGSTLRIELNRESPVSDRLVVSGALVRGGALTVVNLGAALIAGDGFTLWQAGSASGTFSAISLPTLDAGLRWNMSELDSAGLLTVEAVEASFTGWSGAQAFEPGTAAFDADPDADGVANGLEWLLGGDPLANDAGARQPAPLVRTVTPEEFPAVVEGRRYLTLTARVRRGATGVTVVAEAAATIEGLSAPDAATAVVPLGVPVADGDFDLVSYLFTTPIEETSTGRAFIRLRATATP